MWLLSFLLPFFSFLCLSFQLIPREFFFSYSPALFLLFPPSSFSSLSFTSDFPPSSSAVILLTSSVFLSSRCLSPRPSFLPSIFSFCPRCSLPAPPLLFLLIHSSFSHPFSDPSSSHLFLFSLFSVFPLHFHPPPSLSLSLCILEPPLGPAVRPLFPLLTCAHFLSRAHTSPDSLWRRCAFGICPFRCRLTVWHTHMHLNCRIRRWAQFTR